MYKYIFDLDNTLVFTDKLNSEAYNYALDSLGKENINDVKRITREVVFSKYYLTENEKKKLLDLKRRYFIDNITKIQKNDELLFLLSGINSSDCLLWTSAERCRVEAILRYLNLFSAFSFILYSDKKNIKNDLDSICRHFKCQKSSLKVYEADNTLLNKINTFLA